MCIRTAWDNIGLDGGSHLQLVSHPQLCAVWLSCHQENGVPRAPSSSFLSAVPCGVCRLGSAPAHTLLTRPLCRQGSCSSLGTQDPLLPSAWAFPPKDLPSRPLKSFACVAFTPSEFNGLS